MQLRYHNWSIYRFSDCILTSNAYVHTWSCFHGWTWTFYQKFPDRAEEKDSVITKLHLIGDFAKGNANSHFELSGTNFLLSQTFPSLTWTKCSKEWKKFCLSKLVGCCGDIQRHVSHIGEFRDGQSRILLITFLQYKLPMYFCGHQDNRDSCR